VTRTKDDARALAAGVRAGERAAVARLLSLVEAGDPAARPAVASLAPDAGDAYTVGVTGAPGAGKSSLTDRLIAHVRATGDAVSVLAVDPSSPRSGGAILGDRVRMGDHSTDPGVFIRSMATRGQLGGLAAAVPQAIRVLAAAGAPWILVETVGVGQVELDVAGAADTTVVVVTPGWGDGVQTTKAGLLEVADVFVVNKADRPGVDATVQDLVGMLELGRPSDWKPPIVTTVATTGDGVGAVWDAVAAHRAHLEDTGALARRRKARLHDEVRELVRARLLAIAADAASDDVLARAVDDAVRAGSFDPQSVADALVDDALARRRA
jgi:LAO/AO transport system kinase